MNSLTEYIYCCFYCLMVSKHFRHDRAAFAFAISLVLYLLSGLNYIALAGQLYKHVSPWAVFISTVTIGAIGIYFFESRFNKRAFYVEAVKRIDSRNDAVKIGYGLLGGLLFAGSGAAVIYSFLAFGQKL